MSNLETIWLVRRWHPIKRDWFIRKQIVGITESLVLDEYMRQSGCDRSEITADEYLLIAARSAEGRALRKEVNGKTHTAADIVRRAKFLLARRTVPIHLRAIFDMLTEEYQALAFAYHGGRFVSYKIIIDLVKAGWKRTPAPPDEDAE